MADTMNAGSRIWLRLGTIVWFALFLFGLLGLAVVGVLPWWMIALVVLAGIVLGALSWLPRWFVRRKDIAFHRKGSLALHVLGGIFAALGLAALPIYYFAYWVNSGPTALPLATLTNGKKTLVFQGMQHVASEDFYKSVVFDLEKALTDGYVLFYEGVQPVEGRPDLSEWFSETFAGGKKKDLSGNYTQLANSCGLNFQLTYFEPLLVDKKAHPERHITADVSYAEMKTEYDRLMQSDPKFAAAMAAQKAEVKSDEDDPMLKALARVSSASPDQKRLVGIVCRGILGMAMSGGLGKKDDEKEKIILTFRNKALAKFVAESKADKIYMTYGAAHFPGFLKDLTTLDPAWKVKSLRWVRPMSLPTDVEAPPNYPVAVKAGG